MLKKLHTTLLRCVVAMVAVGGCAHGAQAFDLSTYATTSALASGRWVKVSVDHTGMYMISNATLRTMGFNDPSRVVIYGYGGRRIADVMTSTSYIDDLPVAPQQYTDRGIVFYGVGPDSWERSGTTTYYHLESSPYTTVGYYFVTERDDVPESVTATTGVAGSDDIEVETSVQARVHHEQDITLATEAGPLMVGEDFQYTSTREFTFTTPDRVPGSALWFECQFVARHVGTTSQLTFTVNGEEQTANTSDRINSTSDSHYVHASIGTARHTLTPEDYGDKLTIGVSHSSSGIIAQANLDYLCVNYLRALEMPSSGVLEFWVNARALGLSGASSDLVLWDVTDPTKVANVNTAIEGGRVTWRPSSVSMRSYVAWQPDGTFDEPKVVGNVANQDLHAMGGDIDMVIIAPQALMAQGQRIAALHAETDGMNVQVIDAQLVYNEFSSGAADVSGIRKFLKMLYDRGNEGDKTLKYCLLLGRTTMDNRALAASTRALGYETMPAWVSRLAANSMNDNDGFTTDDFIAMLKDGSGNDMGLNDLCVAVGRIPMVSNNDGSPIVDKLIQYVKTSRHSNWKNRIMVLADDEDQGVHLRQAENMVRGFQSTPGQQHIINKVYLDAYTKSDGEYPGARADMFRNLDEGVAWWFFTGHANNHSWTGDGQLTYTDLNNLFLRNIPMLVASTCDFLRWDSETTSGGEIMYKERYGGTIAMVSATRPVYITDNGYYLEALGRALLARDSEGRLLTAGEVYRRSKNDIRNSRGQHVSNPNRLRFVFMGDPALRVVTPDNIIELLTINGKEVRLEDQITIAAMSNATITGRIVRPDGTPIDDFNGVVYVDLYDALTSVTTYGNGDGSIDVFDRIGDKLYAGSAVVTNGTFTLNIAMPQMVADNFRPATISMYATTGDSFGDTEAIGVSSDFYVYGFEEPETPDTTSPTINALYLNHESFKSGDRVNSSPMLIARVSDNVGINLSMAGVGFQMTATLDDTKSMADVSTYYTPASDGTASGTVNYPLEDLTEGAHTLRLRIFDTSGNHAESSIEFFVDDTTPPHIFDVYSDANPAYDSANFYITYDRPETIVNLTVTVYDLWGRPVWTGDARGLSYTDTSVPVTWDLTDNAGRRVQRGIYVYRASIATDTTTYVSASRRIAVAGQ